MIPPAAMAAFLVLDALGARDAKVLANLEVRRGWLARLFGGSAAPQAIRASEGGWLAQAVAPWRQGGGPRTVQVSVDGAVALGRFAELDGGMVAVVVLALEQGVWRFRDVRRLPSAEYHDFGAVEE